MDTLAHNALVAAVAMSLYKYNVALHERVEKIYSHFNGACAEETELMHLVENFNWATEMAAPTALVYMQHALARYRLQAEDRVRINLEPFNAK